MKKKMLLIILSVAVCIALIGGATMAWFTSEAETNDAVFTAGTVEIEADGAEILGKKILEMLIP